MSIYASFSVKLVTSDLHCIFCLDIGMTSKRTLFSSDLHRRYSNSVFCFTIMTMSGKLRVYIESTLNVNTQFLFYG